MVLYHLYRIINIFKKNIIFYSKAVKSILKPVNFQDDKNIKFLNRKPQNQFSEVRLYLINYIV